jgi:type I restriction enzyme M protein
MSGSNAKPASWLRDESLEDSDNLPDPYVLAQEIIEHLEVALEHFAQFAFLREAN